MNEAKNSKNSFLQFFILSVFFFFRTGLTVPMECYGINPVEPHFNFTVQTTVFLVLLIIFSLVSAAFVSAAHKSYGDIAGVLCVLILAEPVYFSLQDDCIKLFVDIILLSFACYCIKKKAVNSIAICLTVFISVFLLPYCVFSYVPLMIVAYIAFNNKEKLSSKRVAVNVLIQLLCAALAFVLNKVLYDNVKVFSSFIDSYSFVQLNHPNKRFSVVMAIIPMIALSFVFTNVYFKQLNKLEKKKQISRKEKDIGVLLLDMMGIVYVVAVIGLIFFEAEAFCTINGILPAIVLAMFVANEKVCIITIDEIVGFINKHKVISLVIIVLIYYISFRFIDNYNSNSKLITYVRF